jgi:hypothetical protein
MLPDSSDRPEEFPSELKAFEASLGALMPRASRVDRDRIMYEAGAAAAVELPWQPQPAKRRWLWPATAAALALVASCLGAALMLRGSPVERIVYVQRPAENPGSNSSALAESYVNGNSDWPTGAAARETMLALREQILHSGVDSLKEGAAGDGRGDQRASRSENRALLNRLLGG